MTRGRGEGPFIALGNWLVELREAARFNSQPQAVQRARHLGLKKVTQGKLSYTERGWTALPEHQLLRELAQLYGVPYENLVARCVEAQYGVHLLPAGVGREKPVSRPRSVLAAFDRTEQRVLKQFRQLTPSDQRLAREMMARLVGSHAQRMAEGEVDPAPDEPVPSVRRPRSTRNR